MQKATVLFFAFVAATNAYAQPVGYADESGKPAQQNLPLDGICVKRDMAEKQPLAYDHIRESDVLWEKRIWRVVDLREKMNQHFAYPLKPFFQLVKDAAIKQNITLYADEGFTRPLSKSACQNIWGRLDTITVGDPENWDQEITKVVQRDIDIESIKRFRIKEVWFFDKETSRMQVRILGIAPLVSKEDENGNFQFEYPLFWAYYPSLRPVLANKEAYIGFNDAVSMSWEDIFEMRFFSSFIYKESNVQDKRLQDMYAGSQMVVESEKITQEIFNQEQEYWGY